MAGFFHVPNSNRMARFTALWIWRKVRLFRYAATFFFQYANISATSVFLKAAPHNLASKLYDVALIIVRIRSNKTQAIPFLHSFSLFDIMKKKMNTIRSVKYERNSRVAAGHKVEVKYIVGLIVWKNEACVSQNWRYTGLLFFMPSPATLPLPPGFPNAWYYPLHHPVIGDSCFHRLPW